MSGVPEELTPTTANEIVRVAEQRASGGVSDSEVGAGAREVLLVGGGASEHDGVIATCHICSGRLEAGGTAMHPFWECPVCGTRTVTG